MVRQVLEPSCYARSSPTDHKAHGGRVWTDRWRNGRPGGWVSGRVYGGIDGVWVNAWMSEYMDGWVDGWVN